MSVEDLELEDQPTTTVSGGSRTMRRRTADGVAVVAPEPEAEQEVQPEPEPSGVDTLIGFPDNGIEDQQ
jgi:hypothetical protein